jgi:hypothetical protein
MKVFTGTKIGRVFFIRIDEGDDVAECVDTFIRENGEPDPQTEPARKAAA